MNRYSLSKVVRKRLEDLNLTAEDVIKKALGIATDGWTDPGTGINFPEDTVFINKYYKGKVCSAVVKDGELRIEDKTFTALSGPAAYYTGSPTQNGWDFFQVWYPDGTIVPAHVVRKNHLAEQEKGADHIEPHMVKKAHSVKPGKKKSKGFLIRTPATT